MEFYTLPQVMEMLHCTNSAVMSLIRNKKLKAIKVGRSWRFYQGALDDFAKRNDEINFRPTIIVTQQKRGRKRNGSIY